MTLIISLGHGHSIRKQSAIVREIYNWECGRDFTQGIKSPTHVQGGLHVGCVRARPDDQGPVSRHEARPQEAWRDDMGGDIDIRRGIRTVIRGVDEIEALISSFVC